MKQISVGYRVKSKQGVRFRQWANSVLKDYIIKGFAVRDNLQIQHYNELKDVVALMARTMALPPRHRVEHLIHYPSGSKKKLVIHFQNAPRARIYR